MSLCERLNKSQLFLVSDKLTQIYNEIFFSYDNIRNNKINIENFKKAKIKNLNIEGLNDNDLFPIVLDDFINNYIKNLSEDLKINIVKL